jgi:hypothetical protein
VTRVNSLNILDEGLRIGKRKIVILDEIDASLDSTRETYVHGSHIF